MDVKDLMTADPITTRPETPMLEARQLMIDKRIRHLLVADGPKLLGKAVTEEILIRIARHVDERQHRDPLAWVR